MNQTIIKKLKNREFEYEDELKQFRVIDPVSKTYMSLSKVEAFAFLRFMIRIAQRNWFRKKK